MKAIKKFLDCLLEIWFRPEMKVLPGQLAFFIILSIFPLLTILGYVGGLIDNFSPSVTSIINDLLPSESANVLISFITESTIKGNEIFFIIIGFLLVSNGTQSLIVTSNELYGFKHKSYLKQKIKSLIMAIILMFLFIFVVLVLAYGSIIVDYIIHRQIFESITDELNKAFWLLKWPFSLVFIFLTIKFLYSVAPDEKIKSKYTNKGALFATIGWFLITEGYSFYVKEFSNYNMFYGNIANIIVMMIWVYLLSTILAMGVALNSNIYRLSSNEEKSD